MARLRVIGASLVVALLWMTAAPLMALTCRPGLECAMQGMAASAAAPRDHGPDVSALDCCGRSERAAVPAAVDVALAVQQLLATATALSAAAAGDVLPPLPDRRSREVAPPAESPPLYRLHAALLL